MKKLPLGSEKKDFYPNSPENLAELCSLCGACEAVCPVYRRTGRETWVARGRMALVRFMSAPPEEPFMTCLLCGACKTRCPSGTNPPEVVRLVRKETLAKETLAFVFSLLVNDAAKEGLLELLNKGSGLVLRLTGLSPPEIKHPPLIQWAQEKGANSPQEIAIFSGCGGNYLYPQAGYGLLELLRPRAFLPSDQTCCGLPFLSAGLKEQARELARRNIKALSGAKLIITPCVSCAATLKEYPDLLPPGEREVARGLASRIIDPTELLPPPQGESVPLFTIHLPCHLRFSPRGEKTFVQRIRQAFGASFIPSKSLCCGHGGLVPLLKPDLTCSLAQERRDSLPEGCLVLTNCTACLIGLRYSLPEIRARHLYDFWLSPEEPLPWPP
ncbi:(Fe-S)-binding protein [Thermosulfuriphilus sp.]